MPPQQQPVSLGVSSSLVLASAGEDRRLSRDSSQRTADAPATRVPAVSGDPSRCDVRARARAGSDSDSDVASDAASDAASETASEAAPAEEPASDAASVSSKRSSSRAGVSANWCMVKRPRSASSVSGASEAADECKGEEELSDRLAADLRLSAAPQEALPGRRGLLNLGNTCYLNAVLQCLAHSPAFARRFIPAPDPEQWESAGTSAEGAAEREVAAALRETLQDMRAPGTGVALRPARLKRALGRVRREFAGRAQQDAQELLRCLLDAAHEGGNRVRGRVPYEEIKDVDGERAQDTARRWWAHFTARNASAVADVFAGQLGSETRCERCGAVSRAFDPVFDLSLPVPAEGAQVTLADCLRAFTAADRLDGDDAAYCGRCREHGAASRALSVQRPPEALVLHLKRFAAGGAGKLRTPVALPLRESLDLAPFLSPAAAGAAGAGGCRYRVTGVVHHAGGMAGGHYTASVRAGERWLRANDEWVSDAADRDVDPATAYLVFLERVRDAEAAPHQTSSL